MKQNAVETGLINASSAAWIPPTTTFASPPGSPVTGSVYLFTDAAYAGASSGGGSSLSLCRWSGSAWVPVAASTIYDLVCSLVGKPGNGATVMIFTATRAVTFGANFSGSYGSVGANPAATAAYDIKKNGSTIGAVSISTGGVFTFTTTSGTAKSLAAGDRLTIAAPSPQDSTLTDVGFTLAGSR